MTTEFGTYEHIIDRNQPVECHGSFDNWKILGNSYPKGFKVKPGIKFIDNSGETQITNDCSRIFLRKEVVILQHQKNDELPVEEIENPELVSKLDEIAETLGVPQESREYFKLGYNIREMVEGGMMDKIFNSEHQKALEKITD